MFGLRKQAKYVSIDAMIFDDNISVERVQKISDEVADVLAKNGLAADNEEDPVMSLIGIEVVRCNPSQLKLFKRLMRQKHQIVIPQDNSDA